MKSLLKSLCLFALLVAVAPSVADAQYTYGLRSPYGGNGGMNYSFRAPSYYWYWNSYSYSYPQYYHRPAVQYYAVQPRYVSESFSYTWTRTSRTMNFYTGAYNHSTPILFSRQVYYPQYWNSSTEKKDLKPEIGYTDVQKFNIHHWDGTSFVSKDDKGNAQDIWKLDEGEEPLLGEYEKKEYIAGVKIVLKHPDGKVEAFWVRCIWNTDTKKWQQTEQVYRFFEKLVNETKSGRET